MNTPVGLVLDGLVRLGGIGFAREVVEAFHGNARARLDAARSAIAGRDDRALRRAAHALKSSCGQLGAAALAERLQELESLAERCDWKAAGESLQTIERDVDEFETLLSASLGAERDRAPKSVVAVVDDSPDTRLLVRRLLEPRFQVREYGSGTAAVDQLALDRPDLVLLDIVLPDLNGFDVLGKLRDDARLGRTPVVAMSAYADAEDRLAFVRGGFDGFVAKPIEDEGEFVATVERLLEPRA